MKFTLALAIVPLTMVIATPVVNTREVVVRSPEELAKMTPEQKRSCFPCGTITCCVPDGPGGK